MSARVWRGLRLIGGAAILAVLVWRLGTGPFLDGLRTISPWPLIVAAAIGVMTTACAAWRWQIVARGLGVGLPFSTAMAAYYRSQFLNTTLPGGVLGDVHRAVRHGRDVGDVGRSARAVVWERGSGQVVQIALTFVVLLVFVSPARSDLPVITFVVACVAIAALLLGRALPTEGTSRGARVKRAVRADLRSGVFARQAWPGILAASVLIVAGHAATFLLAAHTAGTGASLATLLPIAVLVLLAMAVPTNIGGWGPREGAAAWLFGAAGLGAAQGVAVATVYGILVIGAALPGAVVLLATWRRRPTVPTPDLRVPEGALHG